MQNHTDAVELTPSTAALKKSGLSSITYGWIMVGVSFLIQAIGSSIQYMTVLLIEPLKVSLHTSAAAVLMATTSALTLVVAIASPLCGVVLQRYSIRKFMVITFGAVAAGYIGLAYATALWQIGVIYAVAFAVGVLASILAANALVSNWFVAQRGLALGIAGAGISAAGCFMPPLAIYGIEQFGLIATCLTTALIVIALLPIMWLLIIDRPEAKGFPPPAIDQRASTTPLATELPINTEWSIIKLLRNRQFWLISILGALASGVCSAIAVNLMELATAANIDRQTSSYFVSLQATSGIVGAVVFGRIFDITSQRATAQLVIALSAAPCLLLLGHPTQSIFAIASVLVGLSFSASLLAPNVLLAINFGRSGFAVALGIMNSLMMLILVVGIPLFGAVYDSYHSYDRALLGSLIALALTLIAVYFLPGGNIDHDRKPIS